MPVYVYRCRDCGSQLEKRQYFTDSPLTRCEACGGRLQKVLQPTTVIYKGSGFYSTDHSSKSGGNGHNGSSSSPSKEDGAKSTSEAPKEPATAATATKDKDSE